MKYWTGNGPKSCFNCIHSEKDAGFAGSYSTPPVPGTAICKEEFDIDADGNSIVTDENIIEFGLESDKLLPIKCGHYEPVIINQSCGNKKCNNVITGAEYMHKFWSTFEEFIPCCSKECADVIDKAGEAEEDRGQFDDEYAFKKA